MCMCLGVGPGRVSLLKGNLYTGGRVWLLMVPLMLLSSTTELAVATPKNINHASKSTKYMQ